MIRSTLIFICLFAVNITAQSTIKLYEKFIDGSTTLPKNWKKLETFEVPKNQTLQIGNKLGGHIVKLTNTIFAFHGQRVKINIIKCSNPTDAKNIYHKLVNIHRSKFPVFLDNDNAIEFISGDPRTIVYAHYDLGFKPRKVSYQVTFQAAPIKKCDYMQWNKMFNLFLQWDKNKNRAAIAQKINQLSKYFSMAKSIQLRKWGQGNYKSSYSITPHPQKIKAIQDLDRYHFSNLPLKVNFPNIQVKATITSEAFAVTPSERKADKILLQPTRFWLSDDPKIRALAKKIIGGSKTTEAKVQAILQWLYPVNKNMRYFTYVTGSRYGAKKVLQQRFGYCWDFSDCFITLCRAVDVPCRQVAGWLYGVSGHVWAEVLFENHGWLAVDPTSGMPCETRYIPYLTTEDGEWPLVYTSWVSTTIKD